MPPPCTDRHQTHNETQQLLARPSMAGGCLCSMPRKCIHKAQVPTTVLPLQHTGITKNVISKKAWLSEAFIFVAFCWACYWGYWHRLSPPLQTSSVWRRKGPWWLGHCEDRDLTVPSPEKAKQAKWLFHLVLCSCLYGHNASSTVPTAHLCCCRRWSCRYLPLGSTESKSSICTAAALPHHSFFFSSASCQQCWAQSTSRHSSSGAAAACDWGQGAQHIESLRDGRAAGAALPSCQLQFCLRCQEDKLVAITQGHSEIAHAPLLAVTHLENSFWLQIPIREEKI